MIYAALFLFVVAGSEQVQGDCLYSDWSSWSSWQSPSTSHVPGKSWPEPLAGGSIGVPTDGARRREAFMDQREEAMEHAADCRTIGICPALSGHTSTSSAVCSNGFAGIYPCYNVDILSSVSLGDLCGDHCQVPIEELEAIDIWGWTDSLTQKEYALVALSTGTAFVDITTPESAQPLAFMPGTGNIGSSWRDVKVLNDVAYVGSQASGHGLQVYDLAHLRDISQAPVALVSPDTVYTGIGNSHNLVVSQASNTIIAVGATSVGSGGLHAIDVSSPLEPVFAGSYSGDGYTQDAQCVEYTGPDTHHAGQEICFCMNEDTLTVVDLTDKQNGVMLSRTGYAGNQYTQQAWLTADQTVLLMADHLDEQNASPVSMNQTQRTHLWDVSDLDAPVLVNTYFAAFEAIDNNQYIKDGLTYQANFEAGLRILNINQTAFTLSEVAYFDVFPESTAANFNGAFSVYPYYNSGSVVVSSQDSGLFVLRPNITAISQLVAQDETYQERRRYRDVVNSSSAAACPEQVEVDQTTVSRSHFGVNKLSNIIC